MKTYKYIALAAIALGFAACSQEEDFTPQGNQKGAPITIASVGVANLATRATIEDDKLVEGNIGVTITSTGNDNRYKGSNVRWYGSNGVWGLVENQKVVLYEGNGESQKIYAYYPYAKDIIEGTENLPVTLPEAFDSNFEGYDYLCTKEGISLSQNPVSLTLSHAFSKVSVSINMMGNELEGDVVTEIALANVPLNGERSATTGAIDPDKYGPANGRIALYGYDDEDYDEVADYYIGYALPNAATTLDLRVTMQSGRVFTAKAPISGGMTDGVHYKIGLNLGKDKVGISSVTVAPWGTGGTIEGGVAEEVTPTIDLSKYTDGETVNIAEDCRVIGDGNEYNLTLNVTDDAKVTFAAGASGVKLAAPITVADGKTLTLTIRDNVEHIVKGGISLDNGSNVIIEGERNKENNKLTVTGTDGNAGIGANNGVTAGDITIRNARVEATGSSTLVNSNNPVSGAAIGTSDANMGDILIENSIITATGSAHGLSFAAAIGSGSLCRSIGNIVFVDSEITAKITDETLASVIGAGSIMHGEKRLVCTMGDIIFTNTSLDLSIVQNLMSYGALIGIGETDSYSTVKMGKIIFTDMTQAELDAMIATWTYPEDFAEWGAYIIGRSPYNMVNENGTIEGVYVSDGNGGTVQIGNADGYNPTGYVTDWGW